MSYEIQGRTVSMPVEVRRAASWTAQYVVDAGAAERLLIPAGLHVAEPWPGKAIASLSFVRYEDTDLDAYNEVAFAIMVRRHDAPEGGALRRTLEIPSGRVGVYVHRLPVNESFTLEAGRSIWGYPKFLAEITIRSSGPTPVRSSGPSPTPSAGPSPDWTDRSKPARDSDEAIEARGESTTCELRHDGAHVLTLTVPNGGVLPLPSRVVPTYTFTEGILRMTSWTVRWAGGRVRRGGGARLELGNHPMSEEIRSLGLPKRPLVTSHVPAMRARFEAPVVVSAPVPAPPRG